MDYLAINDIWSCGPNVSLGCELFADTILEVRASLKLEISTIYLYIIRANSSVTMITRRWSTHPLVALDLIDLIYYTHNICHIIPMNIIYYYDLLVCYC